MSVTAARNSAGEIIYSLTNRDPHRAATVSTTIEGATAKKVSGLVLTGDAMDSRNTFDDPNKVRPVSFSGAKLSGGSLTIDLPAKSVVVLTLK